MKDWKKYWSAVAWGLLWMVVLSIVGRIVERLTGMDVTAGTSFASGALFWHLLNRAEMKDYKAEIDHLRNELHKAKMEPAARQQLYAMNQGVNEMMKKLK